VRTARSLRLVPAAIALATLAACGTPSADLFVVTRTGAIPGARLTLLVVDDGTVRCNGGPSRRMGDARLLAARDLARELDAPAARDLALAPGPAAVLRYRVRLQRGTAAFSDTSRPLRPGMARLAAFTRDVAKRVCGLAR